MCFPWTGLRRRGRRWDWFLHDARAESNHCMRLPLRYLWLLIGLGYLLLRRLLEEVAFCGLDWGPSATNLRNMLWEQWACRDDFQPFFRLDHYPFLCRLAAHWRHPGV